ncbi:hypothetical protein P692DRAFT_20836669, partial [Suillus brevipes Sb2]
MVIWVRSSSNGSGKDSEVSKLDLHGIYYAGKPPTLEIWCDVCKGADSGTS